METLTASLIIPSKSSYNQKILRPILNFIFPLVLFGVMLLIYKLNVFNIQEVDSNILSTVLYIAAFVVPIIIFLITYYLLQKRKKGTITIDPDKFDIINNDAYHTFEVSKIGKIIIGKEGNVFDISFSFNGDDYTYHFILNSNDEIIFKNIMNIWSDKKQAYYFTETPVETK